MKENKFLDDLFDFLDAMIDSGKEVHVVDRSNPEKIVEHVFNADDDDDIEIDVDVDADVEVEIDDDELPFDEGCPDESCECDNCKYFDECFADEIYHDPEDLPPMLGIPDITRIIFSGRATIVFWEDGTKTVVKAMEGEKVERYAGFAAACMKKMFGSTSHAKAVMDELAVEQVQPVKKKKSDIPVPDMTEAFVVQQAAHNEAIQEAIDEALG